MLRMTCIIAFYRIDRLLVYHLATSYACIVDAVLDIYKDNPTEIILRIRR